MSLIKSLKAVLGSEFGSVADVGSVGDVAGFVDSGSYTLNALISGSLFGGFASNKITALSGDPSVGKTFYALQAVKGFQEADPDNEVLAFESESAITSSMLEQRGIDTKRMAVDAVATVEEFRTKAKRVLDAYAESRKDFSKPRLLLVLDSLGNLSTIKETTDITEGNDKRDMSRAQLIRGAFRILTIACGKLNVPMVLTNHVYAVVGAYVPTKAQSGGGGLSYAASTILNLSKSKEKDGTDVVGAIIKVKTEKSRLTKEQQSVTTLLNFDSGLDRYYGLVEFAEESGVFTRLANKLVLPDGSKQFEKAILGDPKRFFTKDVLDRIDAWVGTRFLYGKGEAPVDEALDDDAAAA